MPSAKILSLSYRDLVGRSREVENQREQNTHNDTCCGKGHPKTTLTKQFPGDEQII